MQFNFVVSTNDRAVRLWESFGFYMCDRSRLRFARRREGLT